MNQENFIEMMEEVTSWLELDASLEGIKLQVTGNCVARWTLPSLKRITSMPTHFYLLSTVTATRWNYPARLYIQGSVEIHNPFTGERYPNQMKYVQLNTMSPAKKIARRVVLLDFPGWVEDMVLQQRMDMHRYEKAVVNRDYLMSMGYVKGAHPWEFIQPMNWHGRTKVTVNLINNTALFVDMVNITEIIERYQNV